MRLLGLVVTNDLKWKANTVSIISKAYSRMWMVKRLKNRGANISDLVDIYITQVRSTLEFGVPVWNSGITAEEKMEIERVQKSFLHIVFGEKYRDYTSALDRASLETLESRREKLCLNFAVKTSRHPKHKHCFSLSIPLPLIQEVQN